MIRLCIFDMDGLLLDSERQIYARCGQEASAAVGRPISMDWMSRQMGNWSEYEENLLNTYGDDYPIEEFWRVYHERMDYIINYVPVPLRPGVKEILEYCRKQGITMCVASSTEGENCAKCLKNAGIYDYFDHIVSGDMAPRSKPAPDIFLKAFEHYDFDRCEVLTFEDSHNGARSALAAGLRLILVKDMAMLSEEDMEEAEMVTDDIRKAIPLIEKENA